MVFDHLTNTYLSEEFVVLADIHINSSSSGEFESRRIAALADELVTLPKNTTIIFAGDTFDRNVPSLADISIFYNLINRLTNSIVERSIYVINGNHDNTTFSFLPSAGFVYLDTPTIINNSLMLVPWTFLNSLSNHLDSNTHKDLILISHARCSIPPFITEEVSIEKLSLNFKQVLLGDIHTTPNLPYDNILYATSPSSITFSKAKKESNGYLRCNTKTNEFTFKPLDLPSKHLVVLDSYNKVKDFLEKRRLKPNKHFVKIRFSGTAEEIRELSRLSAPLVVKDFSLLTEVGSSCSVTENKLKEFLQSNISVVDFAFGYFKDILKIKEQHLIDLKVKYEELRTKKGVHRR